MAYDFNPEEIRVLGCLVEKRLSTPGSYPLTLKSLVTACNQSSNRHPVVDFDSATVNEALKSTRRKSYSAILSSAGSRVPKFEERLCEQLSLDDSEAAVMAELMVRGPQTPGELRQRCTRMHSFDSLASVEVVLTQLGEREEPLVVELTRQPGKQEARYAHLLGGEIDQEPLAVPTPATSKSQLEERVALLEAQMARVLALLENR